MRRRRNVLLSHGVRRATLALLLAGVLASPHADPGSSEDVSIRIPERSLEAIAEEEKGEKEAALRRDRALAERERESVSALETEHKTSAKSLEMRKESAARRIKTLRERIQQSEADVRELTPEIGALEKKADDLEREARNLWDFPDLVQPDGRVYSNRSRAELLMAQAESYRTRAESRRASLERRLRDIQQNEAEIRRLQTELARLVDRRETMEETYRREIEAVRKAIRLRALESISTRDLATNPGLLRQFNLGREMESLILAFADAAWDAGEDWPLDQVLEAVEAELAEAEFVKLLEANTPRNESGH